MIQIKIGHETLELPENFSLDIEDSSPIFNDMGSQSISATVPATKHNLLLLRFPTRPDAFENPNDIKLRCNIDAGAYRRSGIINITSASLRDGITFNIGFDNSTAYDLWAKKKLPELKDLPVLSLGNPALFNKIKSLYTGSKELVDDLAVFPIVIAHKEEDGEKKYIYNEILNLPENIKTHAPSRKVKRMVDGDPVDLYVPEYYGVTPFIRVWRVIELIFADLGYTVLNNPFKADRELARLVVLNNVADACCTGILRYKELLPDVTVEEFLHSLWVRFGMVYNLNYDLGTVKIDLVKDIVEKFSSNELPAKITDYPVINFNQAKYVKLSAETSFDGAKPSCERFEDFIKGYSISNIRFAKNLGDWSHNQSSNDFEPDWPDSNNPFDDDPDWFDDRDYPDPDYPDDRDDDYYDMEPMSVSALLTMSEPTSRAATNGTTNRYLVFEVRTGKWYKIDGLNGKTLDCSSSFFNWDPASANCEAMELHSSDEFVPLALVHYSSVNSSIIYESLTPMYLAGARHFHTWVSTGTVEADADETPLAFMFAFTSSSEDSNGTIGRFSGDTENGYVTFSDGSAHTLSLCFQFNNGLFARFWQKYDEILRHATRSIETECILDKRKLVGLDLLSIYNFSGQRCLIDNLNYTLNHNKWLSGTATLKCIELQGTYNIDTEQGIPPFTPGSRHREWTVLNDNINEVIERMKPTALREWVEANQSYVLSHPKAYPGIANLESWEATGLTPETDPRFQGYAPIRGNAIAQYPIEITYEIYEILDNREEDYLGLITVEASHQVTLTGVWKE